ncbi:hypothetical protein ABB02_01882 [Clostridiaceae bacterium JG1575]|nr:hypothetical protein ABB02_01882 [Clostridiaceae bacterium JG1575]
MNNRKTLIRSILVVLLLIVGLTSLFAYRYINRVLGNIRGEDIPSSETGINQDVKNRINSYDNKIKNILLVGIDRNNNPEDPQRSDTMIILSVDDKNKLLKMSSLMRDTHVKITGYGTDKLNHSYAFGGIKLLMQTVNSNFDMDIEDYVLVDFHDLIAIIDAVDGIEMDLRPEEIPFINNGIRNLNNLEGTSVPYLSHPGKQLLNGTQATSYARIRSTLGGDYERTERQRLVLAKVYSKVRTASVVSLPKYIEQLSPFVKTNLTYNEMFDLGLKVISEPFQMTGHHFPTEATSEEVDTAEWYIKMDKEKTVRELHDYIYLNRAPKKEDNYLKESPR